ncbi:amidohydrolase family protein [Halorientalis litorea]|uniref:amidohydrolase family protein n=1 Tax=Halorientalis litorea TaxID=2931977 RepID=UPI001FF3D74E|nr:amidohydrolase family protein [Halorientalis litorea]
MVTLDDVFVADAVSHAYNLHPSNYAIERYAEPVVDLMLGAEAAMPEQYRRTEESFLTDWDPSVTANMLFRESPVDFTVFHPQSITIFEDGLTSMGKAREFVEAHPNRSAQLASIDIIGMENPGDELARQADEYGVHGVKVYPSYWSDDGHTGFKMDDAETAFPLWERCADLGLDVVAVHKAVPFGNVPLDPYRVDDIEEAAASFPDLNFEIVHGGFILAEETGYRIAEHDNVYVNLEITAADAATRPDQFVETMENLLWAGGKEAVEKVIWGCGTPQFHPRLLLESLWELDFPEMESRDGTYTITDDDKRKMVGANLADAHGFDVDELQDAIGDDEYADTDLADPYSTTPFEVEA